MSKILFVSTVSAAPWGGSEELWFSILNEIEKKDKGIELFVCYKKWTSHSNNIKTLQKKNVKFIFRDDNSLKNKLIRRINNSLGTRIPSDEMNSINRINPDLIILSQGAFFECEAWVKFFLREGYKFILITQAAADTWYVNDEKAKLLSRAFMEAEKCFFVSQANLKLVSDQLGKELTNAHVVFNPIKIDYNIRVPFPKSKGEEFILAVVARFNANAKGQDLIFNVLNSKKWRARSLKVFLFGDGPNKWLFNQWINRLNLENIRVMPFEESIERIWSMCHGLLLPSRHEGMPLSMIEAMFCERMIITTKVAGNMELVENGINGFLASAPTVELLDEALENAWEKRTKWEEMGVKSGIKIRELISPENVSIITGKILENL